MSVETNKLRSTREIVEAVKTALEALETAAGQRAFDRVEIFDLSDYEDALRRLALNQERAALVVWTGDEFDNDRQSIVLTTRRTALLDVFIADRRLDAPVKALVGDAENNLPGVLGLRDLVIPALTGQVLASDAETGAELIYLVPQSTERVIVNADDKRKFPGRQVLIINFQAVGEWLQVGVESSEVFA